MAQIRLGAVIAAVGMTWIGLCLESEMMMSIGAIATLLTLWSDELIERKGGESHE